jgi:type III restriction enzyme
MINSVRQQVDRWRALPNTYRVPGVNHLGTYGRWAFAEFTEVYQIEADFEKKVEPEFSKMIERVVARRN